MPTLWTRMRAELGDVEAQFALAETLRVADVVAAVPWYRRAARGGHVGAQTMLAFLLANGIGVRANPRAAIAWYRRAASQGDVGAQNNLGYMHEQGAGVECDTAKAALWYRLAALQGSATAQVNLALLLLDGRGVERDEAEAVRWLGEAARRDHPAAQFRLGLCLREGVGVARDPVAADHWLRAAAERGDRDAAEALADPRRKTQAQPADLGPAAPVAADPDSLEGPVPDDWESGWPLSADQGRFAPDQPRTSHRSPPSF